MTKSLLILKNTLAALCVPAAVGGIVPVLCISSKQITVESDIDKEYLNIVDGVLYGFKEGVTPDTIRENSYNTLKIPDGVKEIADYAFAYMFDRMSMPITTLILNSDLEKIGMGAFQGCYGFVDPINFHETQLVSIGQDAFNFCQDMTGVITFPDTLKTIGNSAFKNCERITGIVLPSSLEDIDDYAFEKCYHLYTIDITKHEGSKQTFPKWLGRISWAFLNAGDSATEDKQVLISDLSEQQTEWERVLQENTHISDSFKVSLGDKEMCDSTTLNLSSDKKTLLGLNISTSKLREYSVLRVPSSVTKIEAEAFKNVLTSSNCSLTLVLNDDLQEIGDSAFSGCSGIYGQIKLSDSITSIGEYAFSGTHISGKLSLPKNDQLTSIPKQAFANTYISELVLPKNFQPASDSETFGEGAFKNCSRLTVIDCSQMDGNKTPFWKEIKGTDAPFYGVGEKVTIIYPYYATPSFVLSNFGLRFQGLGLSNDVYENFDGFGAEINEAKPAEPFPYHPENPMLGIAYNVVNNNEIVSLNSEYIENKLDYKIIQIPSGITKIRDSAFIDEAKGIFSDPHVHIESVDDCDFEHNWSLVFNPGVQEIGMYAFQRCNGIHGNVSFPSTLTTIKAHAFSGCNNISSFTIPTSVKNIGSYAFEHIAIPKDNDIVQPTQLFKFIDLTSFDSVPGGTEYNWATDSFSLGNNTSGTIYVKNSIRSSFETFLATKGLDTTKWTVKGI